jgi:hypothetical protein
MRTMRPIALRTALALFVGGMMLLPAGPVTTPAYAQEDGASFQGRFVLGFRSVDVNGADRKYREDINLDDGPRLSQFDVLFEPESDEVRALVDRVRLDIDDLGGDPFESLRLSFVKHGRYSLDYSRIESDYFYEDLLFPVEVQSVRNARTGDFHHFEFTRVRDKAKLGLDLSPRALLTLPITLDDVMAAGPNFAHQRRQQFVGRVAVVQRGDQRLHDGSGSVISLGIAPAFERVAGRNVPVREIGGFILIEAEVNAQRHFVEGFAEIQIGRSTVHRITTQHDQQLDLIVVHRLDQGL